VLGGFELYYFMQYSGVSWWIIFSLPNPFSPFLCHVPVSFYYEPTASRIKNNCSSYIEEHLYQLQLEFTVFKAPELIYQLQEGL
jgi:hypothetical protein